MSRTFNITIEVDELYELEYKTQFHNFDQKENEFFIDNKKEVKVFASFDDACEWVKKNPNTEITSFVRIENKLEQLKLWTKS